MHGELREVFHAGQAGLTRVAGILGIALLVELQEALVELVRVDKGDMYRTLGCLLGLATNVLERADAMKGFAEDELVW